MKDNESTASNNKRSNRFNIVEADGTKIRIEMPKGYELKQREIEIRKLDRKTRKQVLVKGWSASLEFAGLIIALREKDRGTIEAEGDHGANEVRPRTGMRSRVDAVRWAYERITKANTRRNVADHVGKATGHITDGALTQQEIFDLIDELGLMRGCESVQTNYKLVRDMFLALFGADKRSFTQNDIRHFYYARCETEPDGKPATQANMRRLGVEKVGIVFPAYMSRKPLTRKTKPVTALGQLKDVKTLFGYLIGHVDSNGNKYLVANPLDGLDLGDAEKGRKPVPTVRRYVALMQHADLAVDRHHIRLSRIYARRGWKSKPRNFNKGMLRCLIAYAFHTGQRIERTSTPDGERRMP